MNKMQSKILVVEDDTSLRDVYVTILQLAGHTVAAAANGVEALEQCEKEAFDVILLDLMMPVLDGVEFLQQAKLHKTAPNTKVIVFSNVSSGKLLDQAKQLGAIDHILKSSLTPHGLMEYVAGVLS